MRFWGKFLTLCEEIGAGCECSSRNDAYALLQNQMQRNGRICITADENLEPLVLAPSFHCKELSTVGSSDGWDYHIPTESQARFLHVQRFVEVHSQRHAYRVI